MNRKYLFVSLFIVAGLALAGTITIAQQAKEPAGQPEPQLPPGWTEADMQACTDAATPGKMHEHLAKGVGVWQGKSTMWMGPGAEPVTSECKTTITPIMDGRYVKCEVSGEMPGMGPFNGFGIYGFDNVTQNFVSIWLDNCGTGIAHGTGELSSDGKTMTRTSTYNCPVTKKPTTMREVEVTTGPNTKSWELFVKDPKSGEEYKAMSIEYTRAS
jgi:hypothetical protein